jgi:hypothetical protein
LTEFSGCAEKEIPKFVLQVFLRPSVISTLPVWTLLSPDSFWILDWGLL